MQLKSLKRMRIDRSAWYNDNICHLIAAPAVTYGIYMPYIWRLYTRHVAHASTANSQLGVVDPGEGIGEVTHFGSISSLSSSKYNLFSFSCKLLIAFYLLACQQQLQLNSLQVRA